LAPCENDFNSINPSRSMLAPALERYQSDGYLVREQAKR
jgi:hypothetical protein